MALSSPSIAFSQLIIPLFLCLFIVLWHFLRLLLYPNPTSLLSNHSLALVSLVETCNMDLQLTCNLFIECLDFGVARGELLGVHGGGLGGIPLPLPTLPISQPLTPPTWYPSPSTTAHSIP